MMGQPAWPDVSHIPDFGNNDERVDEWPGIAAEDTR